MDKKGRQARINLKRGSIVRMKISLTCLRIAGALLRFFTLILKTRELAEEPSESLFSSSTIISTESQAHKEQEASPVNKREEEPVIGTKTSKREGGQSGED